MQKRGCIVGVKLKVAVPGNFAENSDTMIFKMLEKSADGSHVVLIRPSPTPDIATDKR